MPQPSHCSREANQAAIDHANMLHDIRNHLHGLSGVVQLMSHGATRIGQHDAIHIAQSSLRLLSRQLELLAEAQRGRHSSAGVEEVDCHELVGRLCATYTPLSEASGMRLHMECDESLRTVSVDPVALNRLLANLILNAIKHSGATDLKVRARSSGDGVVLLVQDNGRGLPELTTQLVGKLLAGAEVPSDYCRNGLLSCAEISRSSRIGLRLLESSERGVCWQVSVHASGVSAQPGDSSVCQFPGPARSGTSHHRFSAKVSSFRSTEQGALGR